MSEVKKYGETNTDKWVKEMSRSRDIVAEILNFGVSEEQKIKIIHLLSLELEDRNLMLSIVKSVNETEMFEENKIIDV